VLSLIQYFFLKSLSARDLFDFGEQMAVIQRTTTNLNDLSPKSKDLGAELFYLLCRIK